MYIVTPSCEPLFNMAFDEWLFGQVRSGENGVSAVLRLYSWKFPGITIGYNQSPEKAIDYSQIHTSIPIIRRITGGRAIYHDPGELTYSLSLNLDILDPGSRSLRQTNFLISDALVKVIGKFGITAEQSGKTSKDYQSGSNNTLKACFESVTRHEITSGLSKIAGGAQRRIGRYMIHQGSIKINGVSSCAAIGQVEKPPPFGGARNYGCEDFEKIFFKAFEKRLKVSFNYWKPSEKEQVDIKNFIKKFAEKSLEKRGFD